jgi:hypothetical protein
MSIVKKSEERERCYPHERIIPNISRIPGESPKEGTTNSIVEGMQDFRKTVWIG